LIFQKLCPWGQIADLQVPRCEHIKKNLCDALLPKEVVVVTEQIEVELEHLYQHEAEEPMQRPKEGVVETLSYETVQGQQRAWPPGWPIRWVKTASR
jgi:hypothetical protein